LGQALTLYEDPRSCFLRVRAGLSRGGARSRIALGGVSAQPWRATHAEALLKGKPLDDASLTAAADKAFEQARPLKHNAFKVHLGKATLVRALREASAMTI
jgi:xanthine dehydrogenase YagS FAD-binding subunit